MTTQDEGKTAEQLAADEAAAAAAAADGGAGKTEAELQAEQAAAEAAAAAEAEAAAAAAETPEAKAAKEAAKHTQRFSRVTRERDLALQRAADAERLAALALEQGRAGGEKKDEKTEDPKPVPPKFADFNDPDKFSEAIAIYTEQAAAWHSRRAVESTLTEREQATTRTRQADEIARIESEYAGHRAKALAELPDFEEIAENPDLQVTPSMAAAMKSSGAMAPRLLYHLGQNPEEAARIAKLSPGAQFMAIGELKAQLASQAKAQPKPLPKPIVPTGQARSTTKSIDEMGMDEYAAHRNAQLKAQRTGAR